MRNNFLLNILTFIINIVDYSNKKKIFNFFKLKLNDKSISVIDIGAHKGETIIFFLKKFRINFIYAFEPNKDLFIDLKKKFFKKKKIKIFNYAVGNKNENKVLNILTDTASSTINTLNKKSDYFKKKEKILSFFSNNNQILKKKQKIKVKNLSTIIAKYQIMKINVLKIDTEGYEFNVIKGIKKSDFSKIDYIYFEHHYDLMINKGYKFSDINYLLNKNNFFKKYKLKMKFRKSFEYIYEKKYN